MDADARGGAAERLGKVLVHQEALGQRPQVRVAEAAQEAAQALVQFAHVLRRVRQEVGQFDARGVDAVELAEDELQRPLEELHLAPDEEEVAGLEGAELLVAGVPQAGVDGAGAVAEVGLDVQVAVAVGPQLLVDDEVDLLDGVAVGQLLDETAGHASLLGGRDQNGRYRLCG